MRRAVVLFTISLGSSAACTDQLPDPFSGECPAEPPPAPLRPAPTGRNRVAYVTTAGSGQQRLWLRDADQPTAAAVRLDESGDAEGPLPPEDGWPTFQGLWSPAGKHLAVRLADDTIGVIDSALPGFIFRISDQRTIDAAGFLADVPGLWSPDGTRLAFTDWQSRLWVAANDGSPPVALAGGVGGMTVPAWSGDGRWISVQLVDRPSVETWVTPSDAADLEHVGDDLVAWGPAGGQILVRHQVDGWAFHDLDAGWADVKVPAAPEHFPVFTSDGKWRFTPTLSGAPEIRFRGCASPATMDLLDIPPAGLWADARATADGAHVVLSLGPQQSQGWVADRDGDQWKLRLVHAPGPGQRVHGLEVSSTGARAAWLLGWIDVDRVVVTAEDVRDPVEVVLGPLTEGSYWWSPDLRRIAFRAGTSSAPLLRVVDLTDPRMPATLGDLVVPAGHVVTHVTWSPDGSAFGFHEQLDSTEPFPRGELHLVRVAGAALEPPIALGSTLHHGRTAFHWEP